MITKNKYRKNLQEFKILIHHRHNGFKKTDKVWIYESVGKLKGVGQQENSKMNELSIHTIDDLQLHVHHHGIPKVPIRGFGQIYDIALRVLAGGSPLELEEQYHNWC